MTTDYIKKVLNYCIERQEKIKIDYVNNYGRKSTRTIQPIGIREETLSRWRKNQLFLKEVKAQQGKYLNSLEESHFQIIKLSILTIQEALNNDDIPLKVRANIGIQYLRHATKNLIKEFNENKVSELHNIKFKKNFLNS